MSTKIKFNDDHTKRGVEGYYFVKDDILIVYIKPTNSWEDWLSGFTAFPLWSPCVGCFIHAGYWKYALWLDNFISHTAWNSGVREVLIFGYSMGGGIAQIVGEYLQWGPMKTISIDGPRTTSKITSNCNLYYNRGSLVNRIPFWFKRIKNTVCLNNKWRPFWKSHADYDIDGIVEREIRGMM